MSMLVGESPICSSALTPMDALSFYYMFMGWSRIFYDTCTLSTGDVCMPVSATLLEGSGDFGYDTDDGIDIVYLYCYYVWIY